MKKNWNWGLTKNYIKKYKNLSLLILFHRIMKKMVFNVKIVNDPPRLNFIFILQCFLFVFILYKNKKIVDLAILTTDHDIYNYKKIYKFFDKIVDTRGRYYKIDNKNKCFRYKTRVIWLTLRYEGLVL